MTPSRFLLSKSKSAKDFSSLFFSNLLQKIFGLVREPVTAYFFGSSLLYANYLLLRTGADLFAQFTAGNALRANLLPKFTKIYSSHQLVSLKEVFSFSNRFMIFLFIVSQFLQGAIIFYIDSNHSLLLFSLSLLLSLSICFNFFNTMYLTIMQSRGKFLKYSIATTLNSFIVAIFIYPLTLFFGLIGLVFSRLLGIMVLMFSYVLPMNKETDGYEVKLTNRDLNLPTLILGNFSNIIIISSRFVSGIDGSNNITYFTYSVFILNALLTSVISNISTLLLRRMSIKEDKLALYYSVGISLFVGLVLVLGLEFVGYELIKLVFFRGEFTLLDVEETTSFIQRLSYSFILMFISTTLFQPFFSLPSERIRKEKSWMSAIFLSVIFGGMIFLFFSSSLDVQDRSLILIYTASIVSVILSLYSYMIYNKR